MKWFRILRSHSLQLRHLHHPHPSHNPEGGPRLRKNHRMNNVVDRKSRWMSPKRDRYYKARAA